MKTKLVEKRILSKWMENEKAKKELKLLDGTSNKIDYRKEIKSVIR